MNKVYKCIRYFTYIIHNTAILLWFLLFIVTHWFSRKEDAKSSLIILAEYLRIKSPFYSKNIITGRTLKKSNELISKLSKKYKETKVDLFLDQFLCVYKEEFLKREDNGRK